MPHLDLHINVYLKDDKEIEINKKSEVSFTMISYIEGKQKNEEIFIPQKVPHRLRCVGQKQARVMEIWIGDSDEGDVVRVKDDYGREER